MRMRAPSRDYVGRRKNARANATAAAPRVSDADAFGDVDLAKSPECRDMVTLHKGIGDNYQWKAKVAGPPVRKRCGAGHTLRSLVVPLPPDRSQWRRRWGRGGQCAARCPVGFRTYFGP